MLHNLLLLSSQFVLCSSKLIVENFSKSGHEHSRIKSSYLNEMLLPRITREELYIPSYRPPLLLDKHRRGLPLLLPGGVEVISHVN